MFLIALPVSMGVALASGVSPALGLVTAVIGGIVGGVLGGAPLQISGPSAGLAVLVAQLVSKHGLEVFPVMIVAAGALQVVSGLGRIGRFFQAVSPAVVRGMLTGIGILIIASQFHVMIDDDIQGSGLENLLAIPRGLVKAFGERSDAPHLQAALLGIATLVLTAAWDHWKVGRLRILPGPLLGVTFAAAVAAALGLPIRYVAVPESLLDLVHPPTLEALTSWSGAMVFDTVGLAFVASAETLLCATALARIHGRAPRYDRELVAQGVGNLLCGAVGALPMTGVISRSTPNVQAGAVTQWSAILYGVWIAVVVLLIPDLLAVVPMSSLAAVLVYIGFKLIGVGEVRMLAGYGRAVFGIFAATVIGIVTIQLLTGILIGLALSAAQLMYRLSHVEFDVRDRGDRLELHLIGAATFLALPRMAEVLEGLPRGRELHVYFDDLTFIDHSCLDRIALFKASYERSGGEVVVEWEQLVDQWARGPQRPEPTEEVRRAREAEPPTPSPPYTK